MSELTDAEKISNLMAIHESHKQTIRRMREILGLQDGQDLQAGLEDLVEKLKDAEFHERENAAEAVWFEDALGCKDMPFGVNAHKVAQEKLRDLIAKKADLEDSVEHLQKEHRELRDILHNAGFERFEEIPTEEGARSVSLREQVADALVELSEHRKAIEWTAEKPNRNGWYWVKGCPHHWSDELQKLMPFGKYRTEIVRVEDGEIKGSWPWSVEGTVFFAGPIPSPR